MSEYLAPGVYVEEGTTRMRSIEGVATGIACFLGLTERGPAALTPITSWGAYQQYYGGPFGDHDYLPYAVRGFFENGGKSCAIARIVSRRATAAFTTLGDLRLQAAGPGSWGRRIAFDWQQTASDAYSLTVYYWRRESAPFIDRDKPAPWATMPRPDYQERFDDLSLDPLSADYVCERVTVSTSRLLQITASAAGSSAPAQAFSALDSAGDDGDTIDLEDYLGPSNPASPRGLRGLEAGEFDDVALVCAPDASATAGLVDALVEHCTRSQKRFAILDAPRDAHSNQLIALRNAHPSSYAALYAPWLRVAPMVGDTTAVVPPCGHVAGVYARTDEVRGVHKAPANEMVRGVLGLERAHTTREQEQLNAQSINTLRQLTRGGLRVWGARTLSAEGDCRYVNVRRLLIFIVESIRRGCLWAVFEPANESLWAALRQCIEQFLLALWRNGALQGATAERAFFVRVGHDSMSADDIEQGRLLVDIGLAASESGEFIVLRIDLADS